MKKKYNLFTDVIPEISTNHDNVFFYCYDKKGKKELYVYKKEKDQYLIFYHSSDFKAFLKQKGYKVYQNVRDYWLKYFDSYRLFTKYHEVYNHMELFEDRYIDKLDQIIEGRFNLSLLADEDYEDFNTKINYLINNKVYTKDELFMPLLIVIGKILKEKYKVKWTSTNKVNKTPNTLYQEPFLENQHQQFHPYYYLYKFLYSPEDYTPYDDNTPFSHIFDIEDILALVSN